MPTAKLSSGSESRTLLLLQRRRRVGYVAHRKRLALLHAKGQSEVPPLVREHLIERGPLHRLRRIELGRRRPAKGLPALMLGGLLGVGEVRVALDRDRRVLDIRYDLGHRRGNIGRQKGLAVCRPRPLKDSLSSATLAAAPRR